MEHPRLNMDRAAVADVYRSVSIGNIYDIEVVSAVLWHTSPHHTERIVHVLHPYLEQIGLLVARFVPCVRFTSFYSLNFRVYFIQVSLHFEIKKLWFRIFFC